jgi:hypothetical protein
LLLQGLDLLRDVGLDVKGVVSDMGPCNQSLFKKLGVTPDSPSFSHKGVDYLVFFDPPHLLKCLRNNLHKHDFMLHGKRISWRYIRKMFDLDCTKRIALRAAPKLTAAHIDLPPFSKMKVSRAAQIFSHSVYAAMMSYICAQSGEKLPVEALATADFVKQIDCLFDIFNSSSRFDSKIYKQALCEDSPSFEFLTSILNIFQEIECLDIKVQPPCFAGWRQTIKALLLLWDDVKKIDGVQYLMTRKINQDGLENSFSSIRRKGGFCMTPAPKQFVDSYKHILINTCITLSSRSNCEGDSANILLDLLNVPADNPSASTPAVLDIDEDIDIPDEDIEAPGSVRSNVLLYVAGYAAFRYLGSHNCSDCQSLLLGSLNEHLNASSVLIKYKAYNQADSGLHVPAAPFLDVIRSCESIFMRHFEDIMHSSHVLNKFVAMVMSTVDLSFWTSSCSIEKVIRIYLRMRLQYAIKYINNALFELPKGKRNLRYVILSRM